jgi:hypothetical protein
MMGNVQPEFQTRSLIGGCRKMIYFIEHDEAGNIVHVCGDPEATIVPLVNRVVFNDSNGNPLKDGQGEALSPYGSKLLDPVGIDEETFNALKDEGSENFTYSGNAVVKKAVQNG